jgi:ATP-dependent DNA helicase RecG
VIQSGVEFPRLGLAVIDEQHKFGVAQRAHFSDARLTPHVLVMTATPIPRSLCLTQFGDLDLTLMRDVPPGRRPVVTSRIHHRGEQHKAWDFLRRQIGAGRQDAAAEKVYEYLIRTELAGLRVALVHGQMDRDERSQAMRRFREGELDALVSTTVVEVGVDVSNATLMVVLQAERFGLAQLHQLRGRIARGTYQGYCFLFSDSDAADAAERLSALESTTDGFEIAEKDFALRGPGDVLGTRQHGELPLRVADLARDTAELDEAHETALTLVQSGDFDQPEYAPLKQRVLDRFGKLFELPQSG